MAGTDIDYPVMQAVSESSDFYLNHDFNGEDDINGSIFLDSRNDLQDSNDNMIVYGHNMKSGMMFGGLKEYLDKNYWLEHKIITFDTIFQKAQYEIVAVCLSKVEGEETEDCGCRCRKHKISSRASITCDGRSVHRIHADIFFCFEGSALEAECSMAAVLWDMLNFREDCPQFRQKHLTAAEVLEQCQFRTE